MSEYIFRTENPIKDCSICPFVKTAICPSKDDGYIPFGYKRGDCPVNEVPTHGQLKDVDEMFSVLERACCTDSLADTIAREILKGLIKNVPTVIEASV